MSHDDMLASIYESVRKIDREQAALIERLSQHISNNDKLEEQVKVLEERTQSLIWWKQSKNALLWIAAVVGAVSSGLRLIGK